MSPNETQPDNVEPFKPAEPTVSVGVCELVPSPVVVFTKKDAEAVAEMCPIKVRDDAENLIAVTVMTNSEALSKGQAIMIITHHTQQFSNGKPKSKVRGSWQVAVPIKLHNKDDRHVFEVINKEEAERMKKLLADLKAGKSPILQPPPELTPDMLTGGKGDVIV